MSTKDIFFDVLQPKVNTISKSEIISHRQGVIMNFRGLIYAT